jgi:hypothetical protein
MQRFILCLSIFFLGAQSLSAQIASKGSSFVSIGYGFPSATKVKNIYEPSASISWDYKFRGFGPVHLRYEYMLGNRVGLGLSVNAEFGKFYLTNEVKLASNVIEKRNEKLQFNSFNTLGRFNYHFLKNSHYLDVYLGSGVGYSKSSINRIDDGDRTISVEERDRDVSNFKRLVGNAFPEFNTELVFGLRWAVSPNAGFYFEAGKSKSIIQIGFFGKMGKYDAYDRNYWRRLN